MQLTSFEDFFGTLEVMNLFSKAFFALSFLTLVSCAPSSSNGALEIGMPMPEIRLTNLNNQAVNLSSFKGKPILVNFWATWCPPCRAEMPELSALQEKHRADGLVVLGINVSERSTLVQGFLAQFPVKFDILLEDQQNQRLPPLLSVWEGRTDGRYAIPFSFMVGRDGLIKEVVLGYIPSKLQAGVTAILKP
jgi:thiol-disulfide isomerase/thioredoxin